MDGKLKNDKTKLEDPELWKSQCFFAMKNISLLTLNPLVQIKCKRTHLKLQDGFIHTLVQQETRLLHPFAVRF